jgi:hypothetical protein
MTATATDAPLARRILFRVPVIGWILRDLIHGDSDTIWYLLGGLVSLWILSAMTWGLPGLVIPAVAMAPVCLTLIVLVTRG